MTIGYEYDLSGNRTSAQSTGSESYLKTYAYDKNNRLTDISTQSQTLGDKNEYFYYDYNGNQIEKQTITKNI